MTRICIIGLTGSGKTTLARAVAGRLRIPRIELDALYWEPRWTPAAPEVFRARVAEAASVERWVSDGNYFKARDLLWGRADTFVWLDLPFHVSFPRLVRRTIWRGLHQTELWNGNREPFWRNLTQSDSIFLWAIQTYPKHQREFPELLAEQASLGKAVFRLHTQPEIDSWLGSLEPSAVPVGQASLPVP